jgi:uncharacterized OB-fold protein
MMSTNSAGNANENPEYITVEIDMPRKYRWSTGKYMGRTYREAQENKKIVANRCVKCKEVLWPPMEVCGRCKVEAGEDWVELSQTGTVMQYTYLVYPMWDPHYGEKRANPHPNAMILLDGGVYIRHFLEETDADKLKVGMRVEAVWREDDERGEGTSDIQYFRTIDE